MRRFALLTLEFPPQIGGIASYYRNWLSVFSPNDYLVITAKDQIAKNSTENIARINFFQKFIWPSWFFLPWRLHKICRRQKIKTLIVAQILPLGAVALLMKLFWGYEYVVQFHGSDVRFMVKTPRKKWLSKIICGRAKALLAVSDSLAEIVKEFSGREVLVIPPGLVSLTRQQPPIQREQFTILSAGRLVKDKGFDLSLRAVAEVKKEIPAIKYIIIGEGTELKNLQDLVKQLDLQQTVEFVGSKEPEELAAYYRLAKALIVPSRQEGFGLVCLEANSQGTPILAFRVGGLPQAVKEGESGFLINSNDPMALAQKIVEVLRLDAGDYASLEQTARQWAEQFICRAELWNKFLD